VSSTGIASRKKKGPPPAQRLGFTPHELAPPLGVSVGSVYNQINAGRIAIVKSMLPRKIVPRLEAQRVLREVLGDPEWSIDAFDQLAATVRREAPGGVFGGPAS
jgi:hypothetical protein